MVERHGREEFVLYRSKGTEATSQIRRVYASASVLHRLLPALAETPDAIRIIDPPGVRLSEALLLPDQSNHTAGILEGDRRRPGLQEVGEQVLGVPLTTYDFKVNPSKLRPDLVFSASAVIKAARQKVAKTTDRRSEAPLVAIAPLIGEIDRPGQRLARRDGRQPGGEPPASATVINFAASSPPTLAASVFGWVPDNVANF